MLRLQYVAHENVTAADVVHVLLENYKSVLHDLNYTKLALSRTGD